MKQVERKTGLFALGYVENHATLVEELQQLLEGTDQIANFQQINESASKTEYYNGAGYPQFLDGESVTLDNAKYIRFETTYKTNTDEMLYGWFTRNNTSFKGVEWGTDKQFKKCVKRNNTFSIGCMYFDDKEDGVDFLEDIANNIIPETWKFKNKSSTIKHPILKSYLENVLERLRKEAADGANHKIIYSDDKKYVMFNTNLLDKFFHDVIIVGKVEKDRNNFSIRNPYRSRSISDIRKLGFGKKMPEQPKFFDDINDVIFQKGWEIDKDFDAFTHIIQERIERFPEEYKGQPTDILAKKLDDAIAFAVALAQRNYKFIVPMYRPQTHSIQLLMPIYLSGAYSKRPDFALVLTPNKETEMYEPETILPLDAVYQNARLIAKPDELWLNPDIIK